MNPNPVVHKTDLSLPAVVFIQAALFPVAMMFGTYCLRLADPNLNFAIALMIATALLSVSGAALRPSAAVSTAVSSVAITVGATFVLWLFTSSIGGQAPGFLGVVLACVGACAGIFTSRLPVQGAILTAVSWGLVIIVGGYGYLATSSSMRAKNMNQESGSPRYVEMNVMPMLVDFRGPVNWHSMEFVPGHEDTGGTFEAEGSFSRGNVYIRAYDNQASYQIALDTTNLFKRTADDAVNTGLDRSRKWLKEQGVRADALQDLAFTEKGWTATTPKEMKAVVIDQFENSVVIGGYVRLPTNN